MNGLAGPNPTETVTGGKTLELSKYDKVRRPHKAIAGDAEIKVTARTLSTELCCPICLDLLTCTMTTKECLHRFCSECITTALMRGNKECPTCRKKIVSKRSLRPDPNFDFLISKIWPDRKQYDAELSASMQLFQEQSNVQSLQKSIEEGIKAQAAYRKQRVQGSYDYEKRKRRPPKLVDAANGQQQAPQQGDEAATAELTTSSIVEQVRVSLAPANLEIGGADTPQSQQQQPLEVEESPADSADNSADEEESSDDSTSDDSSSLSTDSSLSSSSSSLSTSTTTLRLSPTPKITTIGQMGGGEEQSAPESPMMEEGEGQATMDQMLDEMRRKSEDLEVELAPTRCLLRRGSAPALLKTSHYIRTSSETTISALGEFLLHLAMAPPPPSPSTTTSASPTASSENGGGRPSPSSNSSASIISPPDHFYIVDRHFQLRKLAPADCLASVFLNSIPWDRHLVIFFDFDPPADEQQQTLGRDLEAVIGEEAAKSVATCRPPPIEEMEHTRQIQQCSEGLKMEEEAEMGMGGTSSAEPNGGDQKREEEGTKRAEEEMGVVEQQKAAREPAGGMEMEE